MPNTELNQIYWQEKEMKIVTPLVDGSWLTIVVRSYTEDRLRRAHFRGIGLNKAGNFCHWASSDDVFLNRLVKKQFIENIDELWANRDFGTHSFSIDAGYEIGWDSTGELADEHLEFLEMFCPNRRSVALRVKLDRVDILAPMTQLVTFVVEFKEDSGQPTAVIHSMYPGEDIGPLLNDITSREKRFFFDWGHPGVVAV